MRRERKEDRRNIATVRIIGTVILPSSMVHQQSWCPWYIVPRAHSRFVDSLNIVKLIKLPGKTQFARVSISILDRVEIS